MGKMELDYTINYKCITTSGKSAEYNFKRWKHNENPKYEKDVIKWNKESEKAEKQFINTLNKLGWKFTCNIIYNKGGDKNEKG